MSHSTRVFELCCFSQHVFAHMAVAALLSGGLFVNRAARRGCAVEHFSKQDAHDDNSPDVLFLSDSLHAPRSSARWRMPTSTQECNLQPTRQSTCARAVLSCIRSRPMYFLWSMLNTLRRVARFLRNSIVLRSGVAERLCCL